MSQYNLIFTLGNLNKKEIAEYVNSKNINEKKKVLLFDENTKRLHYREDSYGTLPARLLPKYKIITSILTDKKASAFPGDIVEKFKNKPVLVIAEITDKLEMLTLFKKYVKWLTPNDIAEVLKTLRTKNIDNNSEFQLKLYQIMEYIPKLYELYKNDKDLAQVVEEISVGAGPYNAGNLTLELANWIVSEN